jgi:hypothetical protein
MTGLQMRLIDEAQRIEDADVRARAIMLILANNTQGLIELREYTMESDSIMYNDWDCMCAICDMLWHPQ